MSWKACGRGILAPQDRRKPDAEAWTAKSEICTGDTQGGMKVQNTAASPLQTSCMNLINPITRGAEVGHCVQDFKCCSQQMWRPWHHMKPALNAAHPCQENQAQWRVKRGHTSFIPRLSGERVSSRLPLQDCLPCWGSKGPVKYKTNNQNPKTNLFHTCIPNQCLGRNWVFRDEIFLQVKAQRQQNPKNWSSKIKISYPCTT